MNSNLKIAIFLFTFLTFGTQHVFSQTKIFTAQRTNPHAPKIDGVLDDQVWHHTKWESNFTQYEPVNGDQPTLQTSFSITYDNDNLYAAVKAFDDDIENIEKRISRRDIVEGDFIRIELDTYFDKRTAFVFAVNAAGVRTDVLVSGDNDNWDRNWNPVWFAKVAHHDEGWNAEIKIPLNQLRFSSSETQTWGLQVFRSVYRKQEGSLWRHKNSDASGWVSSYGELHGISGLNTPKRIEILPYGVSKLQTSQEVPGNPFADGQDFSTVGGLDAKIGITNNINLDIAINPDFGQVEADPSEVNLTAFESFFPEKRDFFIEGSNILDFRTDYQTRLFHSRRIGKSPSYFPPTRAGEYADIPDNTSILTALKLTGKTESGLSIGILESFTEKEKATLDFGGNRNRTTVEPFTNYFVSRVQKDYDRGNTIVGGILTAVNRDINESHLDFLPSSAYTGGFDFTKYWQERSYRFTVKSAFSNVRGSKDAILRLQQSPARYFDRVDADHLSFDPNKTSLSGHGGHVSFNKAGNGHWNYNGTVNWSSPGFELNDVGFLRVADRVNHFSWLNYREWNPTGIFNRYNIFTNQWSDWNFDGEKLSSGMNLGFDATFTNFWGLNIGLSRNTDGLQTGTLRGGPAIRSLANWNGWINITSDSRKKFTASFNYWNNIKDEGDNNFHGFISNINWQPRNALKVTLRPNFTKNKNELQYVSTFDFEYGKRYILGKLDQKTFSLTTRINYSLTPDISLQYYGQPFISAGSYSGFKYVTDARAKRYRDRFHQYEANEIAFDKDSQSYAIDENRDGTIDFSLSNPDFNFFQLRSNLVVRWEYSPGSTIFLVWTQNRTGFDSTGNFSIGDDFNNLFDIHPDNVFLIKFNKWLSF